jgi:hypothetical protein
MLNYFFQKLLEKITYLALNLTVRFPSEVSNSDSTLGAYLTRELRISQHSLHNLIWRNPKLVQPHAHRAEKQATMLQTCYQ